MFFKERYKTDPAKITDMLTKGGVSKVEDILQWTDDKKFADIGIKGVQLMQIRTFLKVSLNRPLQLFSNIKRRRQMRIQPAQ